MATPKFATSLLSLVFLSTGLAACGGTGDVARAESSAASDESSRADRLAVGGASAGASTLVPSSVARLRRYSIDPAKVFVAGVSSGGFAAVQMHVAHSATFKGAAIYAGGVYWCAGALGAFGALANCGGLTIATHRASYNSTLAASVAYLDQQSWFGTIDPAVNLKGQPVYLWSGTLDEVVNPLEMVDLETEYRHFGANVRFDRTFHAAHGWESPAGELPCATSGSPYMISCSSNGVAYDSVKSWLSLFLGSLKPRNNGKLSGTLSAFDQIEFGASPVVSMSSTGSVFVPKACARGETCGLVLALHGCLQEAARIGRLWVEEAGIDQWADNNKLVVVYPDTLASSAPGVTNPNGCFDWWGYSNQADPNYAIKSGLQMSVLHAMVQRVTGRP